MNLWEKTRRNHGLEHATISLLLGRVSGGGPMAGYSVPGGFVVLADATTEQIEESAREGLRRMQAGESDLAVSPFCGTNIVVGAGLATLASVVGYRLAGRGFRGLSRAFSNTVLALVASRPLGRTVQQRYTTSADVDGLTIEHVTRYRVGRHAVHWVATSFA